MHQKKFYLVIVVIFLVAVIVGGVYGAVADSRKDFLRENSISGFERANILHDLKKSNKIDDEIIGQLEDEEMVRVILMLDDGNIDSGDSFNRKKRKIKENQKDLLDSLQNRRGFRILHQYQTINAIAAEVDVQTLKELESLGIVDDIQEDRVAYISLAESVPLINADDVWSMTPTGYTGAGQTVCVIDTGVDYTHPAIGGASCSLNYDEETLPEIVENDPHPYPLGESYPPTLVNETIITKPGYGNIAVYFDILEVEEFYDYIEILDENDTSYQKIYSGEDDETPECVDVGGFWSFSVPGDTIKIQIYSDSGDIPSPSVCYGFEISKVRESSGWENCGDFLGGINYVGDYVDPLDDHGHGTHCSGIITSDGNSTGDFRGVAPDAGIVVIKACNEGGVCDESDYAAAIDWCVANKDVYDISVISMSLGGGRYSNPEVDCDPYLAGDAINTAKSQGIFVSVASGNDGYTNGISYPACASGAVSVGATWKDDNLASYSNRGSLLDLLAPGGRGNIAPYPQDPPTPPGYYEEIVSACARNSTEDCMSSYEFGHVYHQADILPGSNLWIRKFGTSMAAPHVAGLAVLMFEANPDLIIDGTQNEVLDAMKTTGVDVSSWKRINATAAVESVIPDVLSITVGNINFDDTDSGDFDLEDVSIEIVSSTGYSVKTEADGPNFCIDYPDCLEGSFNIGYLQWDDSSVWTNYTQTETEILSGSSSGGDPQIVQHKLTVPSGVGAGTYLIELNFKVTST